MKRIILILSVALASCSEHKHDSDKVIGNIHTLQQKEIAAMKKKIIDSMRVALSKTPVAAGTALSKTGWYSASEMKLPTGTAVDFRPEGPTDETKGKGPYYIIIRGFDGKQTI